MSHRTQLHAILVLGFAICPFTHAQGQSQVNPPRTSSAPPQPQLVLPAEEDATRRERAAEDRQGVSAAQSTSAHGFLRVRDLIGLTVRGEANAELGTVYDVYIDPRTFGVQYVVLETSAGADTAARYPVLPWALFQATAASFNEGFITLPFDVARLEGAPVIDIDDPDLAASAAWIDEASAFYAADLRTVRASRPDFDGSSSGALNDTDAVPAERRTPGTAAVPADRSATAPNRQGLRPQQLNPQTGRLNRQRGTDRATTQPADPRVPGRDLNNPRGNAPTATNPPGGRNPPGNAGRVDNPPGGRNPPGNAGPSNDAPGGQTPPGNAGPSSQAPGGGATPSGGNVPSGNAAGSAPPPAGAPQ